VSALVAGHDGARRASSAVEALGAISPDAAAVALGRAAIFALPARSDPFGLSVLEAALSGCALVLGDVPSLRELWGGAALFVDPADPEDLGRALRCLITHPTVREALAARSRSRALGLSPERMALGYLALYDELFARPTRSSDMPRSLASPRAPRA
jgi:glycosyltransferase involved in cell wall biosynthesis